MLANWQGQQLVNSAKANRDGVIRRFSWDLGAVLSDSPLQMDPAAAACPRTFLASLFSENDLIWTGDVGESGSERLARRWRTRREWVNTEEYERIGPFVSPAIWKPATISRAAENVTAAPYTVLDFDGLDGIKPETLEERRALFDASLALVRWLREDRGWHLAAIVWTGGKSLHVWFRTPSQTVLESLRTVHKQLGLDPALIGHPAQPCRLPGQFHAKTGNWSRVLWLQKSWI